ncbi:MAG: hypothetical protein KC731_32300 [Myxococcales bacterium]|nr:hypothetical protein [Myxococcales bacterium]
MSSPPRIPQPPPRQGPRRNRRDGDQRWLAWIWSLALGVGLGISLYRWLPPLTSFVDQWVSRLLMG